MQISKKLINSIFIIILCNNLFSLTLQDLISIAFEYNSEIKSSQSEYEIGILSTKTLNGSYSPGVSLSSSSTIPKNYKWDTSPDSFTSGITYSQPLPGGTTISFETGISCNYIDIQNETFIAQRPNISINLSQSLLPFWIQGQIKDPIKLSLDQQKDALYFQLIYTKKKVLLNLIQNYIYALTTQNEIEIYNNTIRLYEEQIESLTELNASGNINQSKILEIENSKWSAQQNLMTAQSAYADYIQNLKSICGKDFIETEIELSTEKSFENSLSEYINMFTNEDPLEQTYKLKLEILKSQRAIERQSSAVILSLSVQPEWSLETEKQSDWKKAWDDFGKPSNWSLSIGLNFSPAISGIVKQNEDKYQIEYDSAKESYNSYLKQKEFVKQQYVSLLNQYNEQLENITFLYNAGIKEVNDYKTQFEAQNISKLDFDSILTRLNNCYLSKNNIELYITLYDLLIKMN